MLLLQQMLCDIICLIDPLGERIPLERRSCLSALRYSPLKGWEAGPV